MFHCAIERAKRWLGFAVAASSDHMRTSSGPSPATRALRDRFVRSQVATSFTIFEPSDFYFAIVVYFQCMQFDCRLASSQTGDHGGQHGQESEESEESEEDSQEEKEVIVR
jgi:hypothetical protein